MLVKKISVSRHFEKTLKKTVKMSGSGLYELEGIPKAYSIQAAEVQKSREAKIQHLLLHVSPILYLIFCHFYHFQLGNLTRFFLNLVKSHVTVDLQFKHFCVSQFDVPA